MFKKSLDIDDSYAIPEDVKNFCKQAIDSNNKLINDWQSIYNINKEKIDKAMKVGSVCNFKDILKILYKT